MFAGINMFWARIRLILARADRLEQLSDLVSAKKKLRTVGGVCKVLCQKSMCGGRDGGELERALDDVFGI